MTAQARQRGRRLSIALVLPYGDASEGFFPDALLEHLCALAVDRGHDARVVRVFYDGRDRHRDEDVRARLSQWLASRDVDLVIVERLFDPKPIRDHVARRGGRRAVMMSWGDGDVVDGVDLVVGRTPGLVRAGTTRRSPSAGELARAFVGMLEAMEHDAPPSRVPGVASVVDGRLVSAASPLAAPLARPFRAAIEADVICATEAPRITRKALFGNAGCPFALDPVDNPHYAGVRLPVEGELSRLGCAFCHAGGDYQKRPDAELVDELLDQASFWLQNAPDVSELVLVDQHAPRILAPLLRAATERALRPVRWLFSARADAFVREAHRIDDAIAAARAGGHRIELFLSGFEALGDRELERYNKGVTVAELLAAVEAMRARRRADGDVFEHARARGHSLILWNPWTQPEDLAQSIDTMRANGLCELFTDPGKNRLRLYPDLPITYAAERDGAIAEAWEEGDEGAARRKGYAVERPWRFLDERTRLAHALSRALRDRLGPETELPQLAAIVREVRERSTSVERALADLDALERVLPPPPTGERAAVVLFAGACNNGCVACSNRDAFLDDDEAALARRVDLARDRHTRALSFAGREPTLHASFVSLLSRARGDDGRGVGVVSNGRRFAYRAFTESAIASGLSAASVKLFAPRADLADAVARVPGAHAQALSGLDELRRARGMALEIRAPLHATNLACFAEHAEIAAQKSIHWLCIEVALDAVGLGALAAAADAVTRLAARARELGVTVAASPLTAGTRAFDVLPTRALR